MPFRPTVLAAPFQRSSSGKWRPHEQNAEAEDGGQALAAVLKERPDLILMGVQLPIMDGYQVTRQIKADPAMRSIPIIAVTSYALSGEEKKARAAGM
jgi:two-component system cell cycle response regulator DivK